MLFMESKEKINNSSEATDESMSSEDIVSNGNNPDVDSSRHSSGSHHRHRSSSQHRSSSLSKKKSIISRIQHWFEKKFGRRGLLIFNLTLVSSAVLLLGGVLLADYLVTKDADVNQESTMDPPDYSNDYKENSPTQYVASATQSIPIYWESMIAEKTETVKALQAEGGRDCVSFVWASDTHIPDNHTAKTDHLGVLMAKMMENCEIPFAMLSGDIGTRASLSTEAELVESQKQITQHLSPLWGSERLLVALGNHDGTWGNNPNGDGVTGYYQYQFSPERLWNVYFRGQAMDSRRVFSDDGLYFYVDNVVQKTRFIVLNSQFGGEYSIDIYGWAKNNRFQVSCYGQEQLDWLADVALDMPEGYSAIITTHVPPNINYTVDKEQLIGIVNAYSNRTTFNDSYSDGVDGWSNSTINVDFTDAKGEIVALFAGHVHGDSIDTTTMACPILTILAAGAAPNEPYAEDVPERISGTDTETSFDVVTINKKTRTIYCTRVGAGEDREIQY